MWERDGGRRIEGTTAWCKWCGKSCSEGGTDAGWVCVCGEREEAGRGGEGREGGRREREREGVGVGVGVGVCVGGVGWGGVGWGGVGCGWGGVGVGVGVLVLVLVLLLVLDNSISILPRKDTFLESPHSGIVGGLFFAMGQYYSLCGCAAVVSLGAVDMEEGVQVSVQVECGREEVNNGEKQEKDKHEETENERTAKRSSWMT